MYVLANILSTVHRDEEGMGKSMRLLITLCITLVNEVDAGAQLSF